MHYYNYYEFIISDDGEPVDGDGGNFVEDQDLEIEERHDEVIEPPKQHHIDALAKIVIPIVYFISIGIYFLVEYTHH